MPSSHSIAVTAAATALAFERGFSDGVFGLSIILAGAGSAVVVFRERCGVKQRSRHSKRCALARRAVAVFAGAGDGGRHRGVEETVEVFFYDGSAAGKSPAGGRCVKWEIASVAGAEKGAAASSPSDAPFASWSSLRFNGGKRNDLKKILVLGAGPLP